MFPLTSPIRQFVIGCIAIVVIILGGGFWFAWQFASETPHYLQPLWYLLPGLLAALTIIVTALLFLRFTSARKAKELSNLPPASYTESGEIHFRRLLESVELVLWEADIHTWQFLYVGPQAVKLLGYPIEDWYEPDFWVSRIHPEDRAAVTEHCRRACARRQSTELDYRLIRKDDEIVWVHNLISIPKSRSGSIVFRGCLVDITQRKKAEEALRISEERFRSVVEGSLEGIIIHQGDAIRYANPAAARIFGYENAKAMMNLPIENLICKEYAGEMRDRFARCYRDLSVPPHPGWQGRRRDHSRIWISCAGSVIHWHGKPAIVTTVTDITQIKQAEEVLRRTEKMQAISRVATSAAHDFNNILLAISGYVEQLLRRQPDSDQTKQEADDILKAIEQAKSLTRKLLAFETTDRSSEPVEVNDLLRENRRLIGSFLRENIELDIKYDSADCMVNVDREELERVLVNLVVNARDAMKEGGRLTISTAAIEVDGKDKKLPLAPGKYVELVVRDTGTGMKPDIQQHVFEPFFTTKGSEGTGLGLYGVYGFVKKFKGHIDLQSVPNEGTIFRIYLPSSSTQTPERTPVVNEKTAPKPEEEKLQSNATILVVDDEHFVRPVYRRMLESEGYSVLEAVSGENALQLSRQHQGPIDLLVTDVMMPSINGFDLAKTMSQSRPDMKVLFVSGYTNIQEMSTHSEVSEDNMLEKPFLPDALVQKVHRLLAG